MPADKAESAALDSPDLLKAYEKYRQGFQANLDSFYSGLNALEFTNHRHRVGEEAA